MNKDHVQLAWALMRVTCFKLSRLCLILAGTILITEWLFPAKDRSWAVMGPTVFLLVACVFSMALTWPRRSR